MASAQEFGITVIKMDGGSHPLWDWTIVKDGSIRSTVEKVLGK